MEGEKGGFELARDPEEITFHHIMSAAGGGGSVLELNCRKKNRHCSFREKCKVRRLMTTLSEMIRLFLDSQRLSQI